MPSHLQSENGEAFRKLGTICTKKKRRLQKNLERVETLRDKAFFYGFPDISDADRADIGILM